MSFEQKKLTFNKAQKRAYKDVVRDIRNMNDGKQVGKDKITLDQKVIRSRIKKALLEVDGVKEKTAVDWANRIYQKAENYLKRRRDFQIKKMLFEHISTMNRGKSKEEIEAIYQAAVRQAFKPSKAPKFQRPPISAEERAVHVARKKERERLVNQNKHLRVNDFRPKSEEARVKAFYKANPQWA